MGGHGDDEANLIPTTHHINHSALWRDLEEYMKYDSQVEDLVFNAEVYQLGRCNIPLLYFVNMLWQLYYLRRV